MTISQPTQKRIIRLPEVCRKTGLSKSTIWVYARTREDFPKPIKMGGTVTGWLESEIDAWLVAVLPNWQNKGADMQDSSKKEKAANGKAVAAKKIRKNDNGSSTESQCVRLLKALMQGSVTTEEAQQMGIYSPAPRIFELKRQGWAITADMRRVPAADGRLHRVARYHLNQSHPVII